MNVLRWGVCVLLLAVPGLAWADPLTILTLAAYAVGGPLAAAAVAFVGGVYKSSRVRRKQRQANARARADYNAALTDRTVSRLAFDPPHRCVYGRAEVGGDVLAIFSTDKQAVDEAGNAYTKPDALRHLVVHFQTREAHAFHGFKIGGEAVGELAASGYPVAGPFANEQAGIRIVFFTGSLVIDQPALEVLVAHTADGAEYNIPTPVTVTISPDGLTLTGPVGVAVQVSYRISVNVPTVRISPFLGAPDQTVNTYLQALVPGQWTAAHRLQGVCGAVITLDLEDQRFQGGIPDIVADLSGALVYDPRKDSTVPGGSGAHRVDDPATWEWSDNNSLCSRDWLCSPIGYEVAPADVDNSYTVASANACDTPVDLADFSRAAVTWGFDDASAQGWDGSNIIIGSPGSVLVVTPTGSGPLLRRGGLSIVGAEHGAIRARIRRTGGTGWAGRALYTTAGHGESLSFYKSVAQPVYGADGWAEITFDMTALTAGGADWVGATVTGIRLDLGAGLGDVFELDWVSVGPLTLPLYTCNGLITSEESREAVLESLADSMAGSISPSAQWEIQAGVWTPAVMTLTDDDLNGNIDVLQADTEMDDLVNCVRATYVQRGQAAPQEADPYRQATFVAADGAELWQDLQFPFTDSAARVRNLCRIAVERARLGQVLRYPAKIRAWGVRKGQRVVLGTPQYGIAAQTFRVTDWQYTVMGAVELTLEKDDPSVWDLADAPSATIGVNSNLPSPWFVAPLTGLAATSGTATSVRAGDGGIVARVLVSWDAVESPFVLDGGAVVLDWQRQGDTQWNAVPPLPGQATSGYITGVVEGDIIVVRGRARSVRGVLGLASFVGHLVVGKSAPASDVTGFGGSVSKGRISWGWDACADIDYGVTEVRSANSNWGSDLVQPLFRGKANSWQETVSTVGERTRWVKHVDESGNPSSGTSSATVTVASGDLIVDGTGGVDATAYWLGRGAGAIQRSAAGVYTPAAITAQAFSATGSAAPAGYAGRFIIATTADGTSYTNQYTSGSDQASTTYTIPAGVKAVRVRLYLAGGTSTLLDEETISVVFDGQNGAGVSWFFSNQAHTLPASVDGVVSSYAGSGAVLQVYEGSTPLQFNTTLAAGRFTVGAPVVFPGAAITVGALTGSGTSTCTIANHSGASAGQDVITVDYNITARLASGEDVSFPVSQTLTKAKQGEGGAAGAAAQAVKLVASSLVFRVDKAGAASPAAVTLTAAPQNLSGSPSWVTTPTVILSGGATDAVRTLPYANMGANDSVQVAVTWGGRTDSLSVIKVREGADALREVVSNRFHSLPASSAGAVSTYVGSGTSIQVYEGDVPLTYRTAIAVASFTVGAPVVSPIGDLAVGAITGNGTAAATVASHSAATLASRVITITWPITVRRANGVDQNMVAVQTISKALQGEQGDPGAAAKTVNLTASSQVFRLSKSGAVSPGVITLTAAGQNLAGGPSWATSPTTALGGASNATVRTLTYEDLSGEAVTVTVNWDGRSDAVTISKVREGSDALRLLLPNALHGLPASNAGVVSSYTGSGTTLQVLEGDTPLQFNTTLANGRFILSAPVVSPASAITVGAVTGSGTATATVGVHSAASSSVDRITITWAVTARRADGTTVTFPAVQSLVKSKQGVNNVLATVEFFDAAGIVYSNLG